MKKPSAASRSKQPFVVEAINRMAHDLGPRAKLPTAQQLSEKLGVTRATLDRALSTLQSRGIITRRQGSGIYVSRNVDRRSVGLLFGRNMFQTGTSTFYLQLLQLCEERAKSGKEQFSFFLRQTEESDDGCGRIKNRDLSESLREGKLDGLLLCEIHDADFEEALRDFQIPAVAMAPSTIFPSVGFDVEALIRDSVDALAERGCRSIGLLGILTRHYRIFRKHVERAGLSLEENCVVHPEDESDPPFYAHESLGREWMQTCLTRCGGAAGLPDGIVITDDLLARGALLHLKELGIHPGTDLQVATHANKGSLTLEYWQDSLIRSELDPQQMVDAMFHMLEALIAGRKLAKAHVDIPPQIRVGAHLSVNSA